MNAASNARADLHVHSKHSNRPTEWVLRQFRAPESFTEPREVYRLCRERGMRFVTVSDHDSLAGSLEIAHLPGTFLSSEVTVSFPEDGCQLHLLVTGVTEAQHAEIQRLRGNVYELRDYLAAEDAICSVAHPLFRVNDRLTLAHVEKLLVLFNRFEALNGIHDRLANDLVRRVFGALGREELEDMAERHRLAPWGERPWLKSFTGGSDDHGGFYVATTWTETPRAATVEEYLAHLRAGAGEPGGVTGSSLRLTQSLYSITYEYYRRRFLPLLGDRSDPFARLLRSLAQRPGEEEPRPRLARLASWVRRGRAGSARDEAASTGASGAADRSPELALGGFSSRASRDALCALARDAVRHARRGRLAESLGAIANLAPVGLAVAPFLVALRAQHKDADLLAATGRRFLGPDFALRTGGTVWFADGAAPAATEAALTEAALPEAAPAEAIGAAERALAALLTARRGRVVALVCGAAPAQAAVLPVQRFEPLGELPMPGVGGGTLVLPPVVEVLEHCERARYAEVLIATPGPLGLLGLAAGKLLGLRLVGLCDPALPGDLHRTTGDYSVADIAWDYLRWFYHQMDIIHVPTTGDADLLAARGFDPGKITPLAPGTADARRPSERWAGERSRIHPGETIAA